MTKLLSVDWDFFFPEPEHDPHYLYDWGHDEKWPPALLDSIWEIRAGAFLRLGLPLPVTSGKEQGFWSRFKFSQNATLYYADSHLKIYGKEVMRDIDDVWNFDAHHDAYRSESEVRRSGVVTCENWATVFKLSGKDVKWFYPTWKTWAYLDKRRTAIVTGVDPEKPFTRTFDKVFLCRSGTWTPTWIEDKFWRLLDECPIGDRIPLDSMAHREFKLENAQKMLDMERKVFSESRSLH